MNKYILSCCSTADLTEEHFEEIYVRYICFHYELDGVEYSDDLGKSNSFEEFYKKMANGSETKTSQVNSEEFIDYFEPFLRDGNDIMHICLSSGLSGVINSANIAKEYLQEKYPERKILIGDSLGASSGYGLVMQTLSELKKEGKSIDELFEWFEENKLRMNYWFFSTDLSFYIKGGRISKTSGTIGNMLNICPLLNMDNKGELVVRSKVRTKRKVIKAIVEKMEECADKGVDYDGRCYVSHSGCREDAEAVAELVEDTFKKLNGRVEINYVGTTIGSHTGPGTVALFFWGKKREDS